MPKRGQIKHEPAPLRERLGQFDPIGTFVFVPAIVSLLLALQWGGSKYAWGSGRIIALFVVFGLLISVFIGIQFWKQDTATIPPRILLKRSIWSSALYAFCVGGAFFILTFYVRPSFPFSARVPCSLFFFLCSSRSGSKPSAA